MSLQENKDKSKHALFHGTLDPFSGRSDYAFIDEHLADFNYDEVFAFLLDVTLHGSGGPEGYGYILLERQIAIPIYILLQKDRTRFLADLKKGYEAGTISQPQINKMNWGYNKHGGYIEFFRDPVTKKPLHRDKERLDAFENTMKELKAST